MQEEKLQAQPEVSYHVYQPCAAYRLRRVADIAIACALIGLTLPLLCLAALAIKWESPGPVLHERTRIGRGGGRGFQMLRFRITVHDPEGVIPAWTKKMTQVGEFLRYTRIEALPELINVLRGEMSMIDPKVGTPSFLD